MRVKTVAITKSSMPILLQLSFWLHASVLCQQFVFVWAHFPQVCNLQHHSQRDLSQFVFVRDNELDEICFNIFGHRILLQHALSAYLLDPQHTISHAVYGQIQIMASGL